MQAKKSIKLFLSSLATILALTFLTIPVSGQLENHLILKKYGYVDKMHFFTGDPITFIRKGNKYSEESYLQGISINSIIVSGQVIPINDISYVIRYRTGFNFEASGKTLMVAAPGYLVIGAINELFQHRGTKLAASDLVPTRTNLIVAGSLLAAGWIFQSFKVRKYPIRKKFSLVIVQSDPAFNK
jgi:hypothetical protein